MSDEGKKVLFDKLKWVVAPLKQLITKFIATGLVLYWRKKLSVQIFYVMGISSVNNGARLHDIIATGIKMILADEVYSAQDVASATGNIKKILLIFGSYKYFW